MQNMKGEELRAIRRRLGLTQAEFAKALGIHPNSESRQERNEIGIKESVAKVARFLAQTARPRRGGRKARR